MRASSTPPRRRDERGSLLLRGGVIASIEWGQAPTTAEGTRRIDARGLVVAPGLVDLRAFLGEPGAEFRETLGTGSQAAAAGGVTTVVCRPDTDPPIDDPAIIDFIKRRARDKAIVNVLPCAALTKGLHGKEITEIGLLLEAGAVAFGDGAKALRNPQIMRRALIYARDFDALIMNHVEDPDLRGAGVMNEGEFASRKGLPGIPREAETVMLERDLRLARATGGRYHAAMISCADSVDLMRRAKAEGLQRHLRRLDQQSDAERERRWRIPHLLQGLAAAARRGRAAGSGRRVGGRRYRRHRLRSRSPGCRDQAPALRRGGGWRTRHRDAAARRRCGSCTAGQIALPDLLAALSTKPADLLGLRCGRLAPGAIPPI